MRKLLLALALLLVGPAAAQVPLTWPPLQSGQVIPLTASATATTGAFSATLTSQAGKTAYLCGFVVTSAGTTAALVVNATITGTVSGTMNFAYAFVSSGQGLLGASLGPGCIAASGLNTNIVINVPAGGAGTTAALSAWGFLN